MFTLIAFDLDGTLVDSRRDIAESANALLEASGVTPLSEDAIGGMVGEGARTLVERVFAARHHAPPVDALEQFLAIYDTRLLRHTRAYPQMSEVLTALSDRASLALLTNKPLAAARSILAGLDMLRFFADDAMVGGDGPLARKPEPDGLQALMRRAGASAESTVLVGDSVIDWRTATRGQTACCLARYGFGLTGVPLDNLRAVDRVIDAPIELLDL